MKIVLVSGGTGGHIYPGIAIAEEILRRFPQAQILFVGSKEGLERDLIPRAGFQIKLIKARALLRKISYKAISAPFISIIGFFQAIRILKNFDPQVLLSTGGYASLPVVLAAKILKIPIYIHEQNVLPGLTNRFYFKLATKVFLSFEESLAYVEGEVVGNPVRRQILEIKKEEARRRLDLDLERKVFLILGGSQGAHAINQTVLSALPDLADRKIEILHILGPRDYEAVRQKFSEERFPFYHPFSYLYNIEEALAAADLVISRAGATAIAEFLVRALPMILVPFPYSAEGHQDVNARVLAEAGAARVIKNRDFTVKKFLSIILEIDNIDLEKMREAGRRLAKPEAAGRLVNSIWK